MTGNLGKVMSESAQVALGYIKSHAEKLGVSLNFLNSNDLYIHVAEGAAPKDGPSAGITIFASLLSCLMQKPIRSDISMTGEITLSGQVLKIGGCKEKLSAAIRANVKEVFLPKSNCNLQEIEDMQSKLKLHYIDHVEELIPFIFAD